ncbi:MAG: serine hydrolase domain-containing protein [Bdellovibrionota bacterium]|nr:MAG: serine hydrolase domain-containing protein [Bdellovibrionota bacterium]
MTQPVSAFAPSSAEGLNALTPSADPAKLQSVTELLQDAVSDGVFPGAVLIVASFGKPLYVRAVGVKSSLLEKGHPSAMTHETVFDVASLTSAVVTTTLVMQFAERRLVRLEDRVCRYIQPFGVLGKSPITVEQLLNHRSGLPHWIPFFEELVRENAGSRVGILATRGARDFVFNALNRLEIKSAPGGAQVFSDLGFMLLGRLVETLSGLTLDRAAYKGIFQPLGMKSSSFIDLSLIKRRGIHPVTDMIAPTEQCPWREHLLWGEVHDDNAWAMGGIAGHSGLFTNAQDLTIFAADLLRSYHGQRGKLVSPDCVRHFWENGIKEPSESWHLGWDSPGDENSMLSSGLSKQAVGVSGFTGCSMWLEPQRGISIVLMSNRVHPSSSNKKIRNFRPLIHKEILASLD